MNYSTPLTRRQIVSCARVVAVTLAWIVLDKQLRNLPVVFAVLALLGVAEIVDMFDRILEKFVRKRTKGEINTE
jgi:hypothetical protein